MATVSSRSQRSPAPRRRLAPEERKTELINAALSIAAETGDLSAASLERVAEAAGCSRNLVYRYFQHHQGLIDAVAERFRGELLDRIRELPDGLTSRQWLLSVCTLLLDQAEASGPVLMQLFDEPGGQLDRARRQTMVAILTERLRVDGLSTRRAKVVAPIVGATIVGAVGAVVNGAMRGDVVAEVERVLDALLS